MIFSITILGDPVGKGRPRVTTRGGFAHAFTPKRTATWEGNAAYQMHLAWGVATPPLDEPLRVDIRAVAARPKALLGKKHPDGRMWRPRRVDLDNVIKATLDATMNAGVVRDDAIFVLIRGESLYTARNEGPRVEIEIRRIGCAGPDEYAE